MRLAPTRRTSVAAQLSLLSGAVRRLRSAAASALAAIVLFHAPSAHATTVVHFWSKAFGGGAGNDTPWAVAVDGSGNTVATGTFSGTVNFGGANLTSAGGEDVFLAKYDAAGNHVWSLRFGGTGGDQARAVAVAFDGSIYIAGKFFGTANFGGSDLTSAGLDDVFAAKYDAAGGHIWSLGYGGSGTDIATGIAVDAAGNHVVTGFFSNTVWFGSGLPFFTSNGVYDIFLVKYGANLIPQWGYSFGGISSDIPSGVAFDASGNVYAAGLFRFTANFGGSDLTSAGFEDAFLAKYSPTGVHQWSRRMGGADDDAAASVAVDGAGRATITGYFYDTADFGGAPLANAGASDIFLAQYDANGAHLWSQRFGGADYDWGNDVAVDAAGNVLVTGTFTGTVSLGGTPLVSAALEDVFIARYGASGAHDWSRRMGGSSSDYGVSVAYSADGASIAATGAFAGAASFGGPTFVSVGGTQDLFIGRYGADALEPVMRSITDVGNDQGRRVRIAFSRSGFDQPGSPATITQYEAYLRDDALPAASATGDTDPARRTLLAQGWEFVGAVPAHGASEYLIGAPTDTDSTIAFGQHYSAYFIRAATADPVVFFDSPIDSGYSIDNLAPPAPANLAYSTGTLSWRESPAPDFDYFTVYGSPSPVFDASAVLIAHTTATAADVTASPYDNYYVTATDFSGNEGAASRIRTASGVGGDSPPRTLAVNAYPNPFNPRTTIRYDVPSGGRVVVSVFNAAGARVATLVSAERGPGSYSVSWEGRNDGGAPVSSGVYFVRVELNGNTTARKIALVK